MQHQKLAALLSIAAGLVQAAPSARASTGFSSECSDITYNTAWLIANCPNDAGTLISSGVYLGSHVTNSQGKLEWQTDGAYEESCTECELLDSGATLQCYCTGTFTNENGNSTLDLETYIANYDGHLLSSLEGTPTVPADAAIAVPSDVVLNLSAYTTGTCPSTYSSTLEFAGPETCWDLNLAVDPIVWGTLYANVNEGWLVQAYNVLTCSGTPVATLDLDNVGECVTVGENAAYLSITPLWNWD